jgi:amino-acid N-acetyltransferase
VIDVNIAGGADLAAIRALLEGSGLPTTDLAVAQPEFAVVREGGAVVAAGALQLCGTCALLRSVVVAPHRRGGGLGQAIVAELERLARARRVSQLFLLTQTASGFFAGLGYRASERSAAPPEVQASKEFRSLCPSSAICMAKNLVPGLP